MAKKIDYSALVQILERYFTKDKLADLLEQAKLKKSGNKTELIERLLNYDISYLLSKLYKEELAEICEEFGIPKKRTKQEMIGELVREVGFQTHVYTQQKPRENDESIFKEVIEALKKIEPPRLRSVDKPEFYLEYYILGFLEGYFMEQGIDVNNQSVGVDRGRESRPDIVVDRRVAVEIKALKTKRELQRGLGQLQEYSHIFPYVILYLYDPEGISRGIEAKIQNTEIIRYPR